MQLERIFDPEKDGRQIVDAKHREFVEHELLWLQLLDAFEGGRRYQTATYGIDIRGLPIRNLIRHKHEFPADGKSEIEGFLFNSITVSPIVSQMLGLASFFPGAPGCDPSVFSPLGDYWLRLGRTPVPTFFADAIETHLGKIYNREIRREGPPDLEEWWQDVDGRGSTIDQWMAEVIAPLLFVTGQIDVVFEHPPKPESESVNSQLDVKRLRLDKCVASYILPNNMPWWNADRSGRYLECVVREWDQNAAKPLNKNSNKSDEPNGETSALFRYWNDEGSWLFGPEGKLIDRVPHGFGRVPIVRLFDKRNLRRQHIGKSRYESVAHLQREYYNRNSELILSDTLQAHPLLQMPEDFLQAEGTVSVGPSFVLPMKKNTDGSGGVNYERSSYLEPPKGAADSLRQNLELIENAIDRETKMTKPAGAAGTTGKTVAQSGVSKRLDAVEGNELLPKLARSLAHAEETMAEFALLILRDKTPDPADIEQIKIWYPTTFDLFSIDDLVESALNFQTILSQSGDAPEAEIAMLTTIVRKTLPGMADAVYEAIDAEIEDTVRAKATAKQTTMESLSFRGGNLQAAQPQTDAFADDATESSDAERQPGIEGDGVVGIGTDTI